MSKINDGGPAFPVPGLQNDADFNGMSLRDAFAMKAMQAVESPRFYMGFRETQESLETWAKRCWKMADAMLRARGAQ